MASLASAAESGVVAPCQHACLQVVEKVAMAPIQATILMRLAMVMRRTGESNQADVVVVRANIVVGAGIGPAVVAAGIVVAVDATDGEMGIVVGTETAGSVAKWVRGKEGSLQQVL